MGRRVFLAMVMAGTALIAASAVAASLVLRSSTLQLPLGAAPEGRPPSPPAAAKPPHDTISLAFVGDIMAHYTNFTHRPYSAIYDHVAPTLDHVDLAFANLEFVVDPSRPYAGYPAFNVHPEYVEAAIDAGFRVFSAANNHTYDYGAAGVTATYHSLDLLRSKRHIVFSGIRLHGAKAYAPETIEQDGWRIGFLAITEFLNQYVRSDQVDVVNFRNATERKAFLKSLKAMTAGYDAFILSVHGGTQYSLKPNPAKEAFFREVLKEGVTIVWSHHPHVLQRWEIESVGATDRLILDSTGNFISAQTSAVDPATPWVPRTYTGDSAIFRVTLMREAAGASVASVGPILTSNYKTKEGQIIIEPLAALARQELPKKWRAYYLYRLRVMRGLVRGERLMADGSRRRIVTAWSGGASAELVP